MKALLGLGLLLAVATAAASLLASFGLQQQRELTIATVSHGGGHMYMVPLADLAHLADKNDSPSRSSMQLFENERPVGPAHSMHADIVTSGNGRFSHYDRYLYFSASDNTDVRSNGRSYVARYTWKVPPFIPALLAAGTVACFVPLASRQGLRRTWRVPISRTLPARRALVSALYQRSESAAFFAACAALASLGFVWTGTERSATIDATRAVSTGDHMYVYELVALESFSDTNDTPLRSSLVLFENGQPLGPAHSLHAQIMAQGAGRYSHYNEHLYFSASDNSDVTQNGRSYSIVYETHMSATVPTGLAVLALSCVVLGAGRRAGGSLRLVRADHFSEALAASGMRSLLLLCIALIGTRTATLLYETPEVVGEDLAKLRDGVRCAVAILAALCGGALLGLRQKSVDPKQLFQTLGQTLFLLALGASLSTQPKAFAMWAALGLALIVVARQFSIAQWQSASRLFDPARFTDTSANAHSLVWRITGLSVALTLLNVLPEVVQYWDQSGWMDSRLYDNLAHDIARGAAPFGNSEYAPLFQYWMAALYWTFGHFFFVEQVFNVALACVTPLCMCWAAWFLFRNLVAVVASGLFVAYSSVIHHAVWYTQIENLYIPVFASSVLALAYYLCRRDHLSVILLGLAAAALFATRLQSAFYVATLPAAILLIHGMTARRRIRHLAIYGAVLVLVGVLPWSLRNWSQDEGFTPSSKQSTLLLAVLNDPRIPLYGIRYWERTAEVYAEWAQRYPDLRQRQLALRDFFRDRLLHEPTYFIDAAPWRLAAFYGMLPGAYLGPEWSESTRIGFFEGWLPHWRQRHDLLVPVVLSLIGLTWGGGSAVAWLLAALVVSNVAVGLMVGLAEPRLCYPVLLLHLLLALRLVARFATLSHETPAALGQTLVNLRRPVIRVLAALIVLTIFSRELLGVHHQYREIPSVSWRRTPNIAIDRNLPEISFVGNQLQVDGRDALSLEVGKRYRVKLVLTSYMLPPPFVKGLPGVSDALSQPGSVQYFYAYVGQWNGGSIPLRFDGASVAAPLHEHDVIECELTVEDVSTPSGSPVANWSVLERAVLLGEADGEPY